MAKGNDTAAITTGPHHDKTGSVVSIKGSTSTVRIRTATGTKDVQVPTSSVVPIRKWL